MKILVDENIPIITVQALQSLGHEVLDVRNAPDKDMEDAALWAVAQREGRLLITTDKGFVQRRDQAHHGIRIVRLRQPDQQKIHERIMQVISQFDTWPGLLVVVRDTVQSVWRTG